MAPEPSPHPPKTLTFNILDEIDSDYCHEEVLVRLIHFWEARNFKKGDTLIGLELLLIDSEVSPTNFIYDSRMNVLSMGLRLLLSAEVDHVKKDYKFGLGVNVG